jgi:carbohydrate-binding DOMON domain-containing protein
MEHPSHVTGDVYMYDVYMYVCMTVSLLCFEPPTLIYTPTHTHTHTYTHTHTLTLTHTHTHTPTYIHTHTHVTELVLRGIFLLSKRELEWMYQGPGG